MVEYVKLYLLTATWTSYTFWAIYHFSFLFINLLTDRITRCWQCPMW